MPDIWLIILVVVGLLAFAIGVWFAAGGGRRSDDSIEPTSPPTVPGAEGMLVSGRPKTFRQGNQGRRSNHES